MTYEEAVANHAWRVPERYNIAEDVCDKHPPEQLAMLWEDFRGNERTVTWGELQDASNRLGSVLRRHGVEVGDRVAMLLTPRPETAAAFLGTFKAGAILLSLSVLYGDDGIRHRVTDSEAKILVTNAENVERVRALDLPVEHVLVLDEDLIASGDPAFRRVDTAADDPAQLYYTSGTTGLAKGILHAHRYLLGHTEFELCHDVRAGERFHGMGEWAWAAGIAPLLGPWRFGALQVVYEREAGFDPAKQLAFLSKYDEVSRQDLGTRALLVHNPTLLANGILFRTDRTDRQQPPVHFGDRALLKSASRLQTVGDQYGEILLGQSPGLNLADDR